MADNAKKPFIVEDSTMPIQQFGDHENDETMDDNNGKSWCL